MVVQAIVLTLGLSAGIPHAAFAQTSRNAPDVLPGKGLNQYDFFYAGEAKARNMYIIEKGKITWSYIDTTGRGEN